MSLFQCSKCGCIENTALCGYWWKNDRLCSQCDPEIGKWHGKFDKKPARGMMLGNDGFLYSELVVTSGSMIWREKIQGFRILGKIK